MTKPLAVEWWKLEGFMYVARVRWTRGPYTNTVERKLDFISYHLIKWIHGEEKLKDMATNISRYDNDHG